MKVYNTLSGEKEEFLPQGDEVKMYVCGVTPYSDAHIGHAMSYVIFDVIRRYLQYRGYKVKYVQNITDIDDKIIDRANRLGVSTQELVGKYTTSYFEDMDALNIGRADIYPKATEEIPQMIEIIQGLVNKGYAYPTQGSVYFRVRNVPNYGRLSHRSLGSMMTAEGALGSEDKESPMDFVLWKAAKPDEPSWESPWGLGRPGWHIECSAMSLKYLGHTLDIHGGGQDLIFPHHENEIAQSESFTGKKPFVKYWLHNGLLQLGEEKMSKSLGNLVTIKEALEKYSADAIRIFIISSHYRSPLTYSEEALEAAANGVERLVRVRLRDDPSRDAEEAFDTEPYHRQFIEAMNDDFNTSQALGILFDLARAINQAADSGLGFRNAQSLLSQLARDVLGLKITMLDSFIRIPPSEIEPLVIPLVEARHVLRRAKRFMPADEIRAELNKLGIILEDDSSGTRTMWKRASEPTAPETEPLANLAVKVQPILEEIGHLKLADEIRTKLAGLGVALEDTPQGTVWRIKR
ncbi:cysteine--tRNA ligase [Chloroflexota bacterium]